MILVFLITDFLSFWTENAANSKICIFSSTYPNLANDIPLDSEKCEEHNGTIKVGLLNYFQILEFEYVNPSILDLIQIVET